MEKLFLFILSFLFLFSVDSYASFSGRWSGAGSLFYGAEEIACDKARLQITINKKFFYLSHLFYRCGKKVVNWKPMWFVRKGNNLFFEGKFAGSLVGNRLELSLGSEGESGFIATEIEERNNLIEIKDLRYSPDGGELASIVFTKEKFSKKENL